MARHRYDERFWRERVERWDASGLSAVDFGAREGLKADRLLFWKRRLRASSAMAVAGVSFAKVTVQPVVPEVALEPLEVVLRTGHLIRVRARFDEGVLLRLVTVLGGA
ncbi:MAG TPA: IS66 family insertion sequence element accessory protein TnpB [Polyangiaceae bacterium]|nr:IS66 family insertion sequence element accessory protein TnpB [Polyangiaceae bacterium]